MFNRMPERDLVAWNAIFSGHAQNGLAKRALEFVFMMQRERKRLDSITLVKVLEFVFMMQRERKMLDSITLVKVFEVLC